MPDHDLLPHDALPITEAPPTAAPLAAASVPLGVLDEPARPAADEWAVPRVRPRAGLLARMRHDERGEGVISAAIAVLIMAFIGVAAFVAYRGIMGSVTEKTSQCVDVYVSNGSGCD